MLLIAAVVLAAWMLAGVLALSLCVAARRGDRALERLLRTPESGPIVDFVATFAEPQAAPVPSRAAVR